MLTLIQKGRSLTFYIPVSMAQFYYLTLMLQGYEALLYCMRSQSWSLPKEIVDLLCLRLCCHLFSHRDKSVPHNCQLQNLLTRVLFIVSLYQNIIMSFSFSQL